MPWILSLYLTVYKIDSAKREGPHVDRVCRTSFGQGLMTSFERVAWIHNLNLVKYKSDLANGKDPMLAEWVGRRSTKMSSQWVSWDT